MEIFCRAQLVWKCLSFRHLECIFLGVAVLLRFHATVRKAIQTITIRPHLPLILNYMCESLFCTEINISRTSAQWGMATPGQRHFLMLKKNTKSMKYRSLWPTFSLRSNSGHIHSFIPSFHVAMKVQGKITGS